MKSTITRRTWKAIYRLLDKVSPVDYNCGSLCGCACCIPEESQLNSLSQDIYFSEAIINDPNDFNSDFENGIYLLPGEDKLHSKKDYWLTWSSDFAENYDFPDSWHGKVHFIKCNTPPSCPRNFRPLQCRTYPLFPIIDENNNLDLILNPMYTQYECPLIYNNIPLNKSFYDATLTVWKKLITDPLIFDLVKLDSQNIDEDLILYPQLI